LKALTGVLERHRNQLRDHLPWVWLYELEVPSSTPVRIRITSYTEPVDFGVDAQGGPVTYYPFPVVHGGWRETAEGDLPTVEVTVANVSREVGLLVEQYGGFIGRPAVIRLVNVADLGNTGSQLLERAEVRGVAVSAEACTFTLSAYGLYQRKCPPWRYVPLTCRWQFGGPECGYVIPSGANNTIGGGFNRCPKSLSACETRGDDEVARSLSRGHPKRFGGWPGIPRQAAGV